MNELILKEIYVENKLLKIAYDKNVSSKPSEEKAKSNINLESVLMLRKFIQNS